jgi:lipoprotein-anchoring transpeptidase ErfK/SrfK
MSRRKTMSFPKMLIIGSVGIFGFISLIGFFKGSKNKENKKQIVTNIPKIIQEPKKTIKIEPIKIQTLIKKEKKIAKKAVVKKQEEKEDDFPQINLIDRLFVANNSKLPIVETVTYTSRVPWLKGRPAWLADYASHFETSRHFIARSLNKKKDYFNQNISYGDKFNVLRKDIEVSFHLLIDLSKARMWFYAIDNDAKERILLKTYKVGLGRKDSKKPSGCLTPIGKYTLGNKIAIYKEGSKGYFQDRKIEMIRVFGTRWIPFEKEIDNCSDTPRGYGIHGAPWSNKDNSVSLIEEKETIGKYTSDGCIRLFSEDIEEIFAIVITKPTVVEIVKDINDANLPGKEKQYSN